MTTIRKDRDCCSSCGHLFDPHLIIPTQQDASAGGIIICPVKGCDCFATWSVGVKGDKVNVRIPDEAELAKIREELQKDET